MNNEKTITICGKEVKMRYCAAAETGYEELSNKSSDVFSPTINKRDENGKPIDVTPPKATEKDYILLAVAAIIAYYAKHEETEPIKTEDILFDANAQDVTNLIITIVQLRNNWYKVPDVIKPEMEESDKQEKNA